MRPKNRQRGSVGCNGPEPHRPQNPLYLSMSVSRDESRKPLAKGLLSIFSLVIWKTADIQRLTLFPRTAVDPSSSSLRRHAQPSVGVL